MITVYKVRVDGNYQSLESVNKAAYLAARKKTWKFDGYPVEGKWEKLDVYVREPTLKKPDIWGLANTLVFEEEAAKKVQLCLDQAAQQFRLPFDDRKLIVANVTYVIDCLDKKKTVYDSDDSDIIEKYSFHKSRLDYSLFKIPETMHSDILTVEGLASPDDEFKPLIEKHGLKGLIFQKLWSSK